MPQDLKEIAIIKTLVASKGEAQKISEALIAQKLAACANRHEVDSCFFWQEKICDEKEWLVVFKTTDEKVSEALSALERLLSYQVPCIIVERHQVNRAYFDWMTQTLANT